MWTWKSYTEGYPITLPLILVSNNTRQRNLSSSQPKIKAKLELVQVKMKIKYPLSKTVLRIHSLNLV